MVSLVLAEAFLDKFGGDTIGDARAALANYRARVDERLSR
jgi:hypothetical protein